VKWNGPFMGEVLGSIAEDGRFKLWQEDVTEVPTSSRRFKLITNIGSDTRAPFMSLDFKNILQDTWVALVTRDGRLTVYEPLDQSNLSEWNLIAQKWVCEIPPDRQEEVGFKVCVHREKLPCWTSIMAGLDRKALSLAVAAMHNVQVFRTDKAKRFYLAAELKGARQVIRDIAWANGSMRGYDVIATASKDGAIRVYELTTPQSTKKTSTANISAASTAADNMVSPRLRGPRSNPPSGIGAGLAGASRVNDNAQDNEQHPGRVRHVVKMVAELTQHHGAVWRVAFSQMGR
jgi:nucleoporin SEH1